MTSVRKEQHVFQFVEDRPLGMGILFRLPDGSDVAANALEASLRLRRRQFCILNIYEPTNDVLLFSQNRPTSRLDGISGEYGLNYERLQQVFHSGQIQTAVPQPKHHFLDTARLPDGEVAQVVPASSDAMYLLRAVDDLKVC